MGSEPAAGAKLGHKWSFPRHERRDGATIPPLLPLPLPDEFLRGAAKRHLHSCREHSRRRQQRGPAQGSPERKAADHGHLPSFPAPPARLCSPGPKRTRETLPGLPRPWGPPQRGHGEHLLPQARNLPCSPELPSDLLCIVALKLTFTRASGVRWGEAAELSPSVAGLGSRPVCCPGVLRGTSPVEFVSLPGNCQGRSTCTAGGVGAAGGLRCAPR